MPLVINTNVSALNSQRQLVKSGNDLSQAMERLASGKRVNTAADDAAGLAIANRMTAQIQGLNQAIRNANDGISMMQTAEGALDETTNILQRIRALAIQSANGIYSDADRNTLDAEAQQLKAELDRIANSTDFNGQPLLDGSLGIVDLQIGSQANQIVSLEIGTMDSESLGGSTGGDIIGTVMSVSPAAIAAIDGTANDELFINSQNVGDLTAATNMEELLNTINTNVSGVDVSAFTEIVATSDGDGIMRGSANYMQLSLVMADGSANVYQITESGSMEELADRIVEITGGVVDASINDASRLVMSNAEGASITVAYNGATAANTGVTAAAYQPQLSLDSTSDTNNGVTVTYGTNLTAANVAQIGINSRTAAGFLEGETAVNGLFALVEGDLILNDVEIGTVAGNGTAATQVGQLVTAINLLSQEHGVVASLTGAVLELNSVDNSEISINFGESAPTAANMLAGYGLFETNIATTVGDSVADIDISTAAGSQQAIDIVDRALDTINAVRSEMGAVTNRLEFTMSNLMNVSENSVAARSRIMDADYAAETSNLSRSQVLQQASQAMLAQANARPQQVLQLLQG